VSYRYLPWTRRGLAAEVEGPDALGDTIASRGEFGVKVALNTGAEPEVDLRLYGPGDVIGIDPRVIVRLEPKRLAHDAEPDKFAAIDFDPPDFPWIFTPAAPGADERLRPWCVLVVVERQTGVDVEAPGDRPLPRLAIGPPAVPGDELPDLAESWAWAHTQVLDDPAAGGLAEQLTRRPNLNVSRLMCPRRLESGRTYLACLVPAFETGRLAGLGQDVPESDTTGPAWGSGEHAPSSTVLPLYFHWEFKTGPAGDFESLARRLTPRKVPDGVGRQPIFLGDADPALPRLDPDDQGAVLGLEGALRAPLPGAGSGPEDVPAGLRNALEKLLEAPGRHVVEGADPDAEAVAPPLYAQWHVRQHEIPADRPRWFRDLNIDPRLRATGGLGAEVVRANQEEYLDAAWRQVGEIVEANRLLNLARMARELAARVHARHVAVLDGQELFALTAPIHRRVLVDERTAQALVAAAVLPSGATDPSFRRMAAPQNAVLKRAARFADAELVEGGGVAVNVVNELAAGEHLLEPVAGVPDGLVASTLLEEVEVGNVADETAIEPFEGLGTMTAGVVRQALAAREELEGAPREPLAVRPDLALSGMVLDVHVGRIGMLEGSLTPTAEITDGLREAALGNRDSVGFVLPHAGDEVSVEVLDLADDGLLVLRAGPEATPVGRLAPEVAARLDRAEVGELVGRLPPGTIDPGGVGPAIEDVTVVVGDTEVIEPIEPVADRPPAPTVPPLVRDRLVVERFASAFEERAVAVAEVEASIVPEPAKLTLGELKGTLVEATAPGQLIEARAASRIAIGGAHLGELAEDVDARVDPDLDPVLAFPVFPRPTYSDLARHDEERLLPGLGLIPADTVTLLETNPRFVEAFLAGMNHEMSRELLWREFPTDRRGSPFRRFWDRVDGAPDVEPVHLWNPARRLGNNSLGDIGGSLVLLVRGDLLRRYPNAVVYATPSKADRRLDENPATIKLPVFGGQLGTDVTFVGFDLTVEDVEVEPGWFFVIQEQPTEPRFGLDVPDPDGDPALTRWSDLTWGHAGVASGGHLRIDGSPLDGRNLPLAPAPAPSARFATNSAHVAAITFQRPFRAAIHASDVLAGTS
jgi:hypothetical protein